MLDRLLRTDHRALDKNDPARKVLGWLRGDSKEVPIIVDGKRPYGIPNKTAFMSSRFHDNAAIGKYTRPTPRLHENASLGEALEACSRSLAPYLPVTKENGTLAGYVRAVDLASEMNSDLRAADLAQKVPMLGQDEIIGRAIKAFQDTPLDELPVTDEQGRLVGVLPRRNVIEIEMGRLQSQGNGDRAAQNDAMQRDTVHDFMEAGAIHLPPDADYERVLQTLRETGYAIVYDERGGAGTVLGALLPELVVRAVRPHHEVPQSGSTHGAGRPSR